jgi:hypothetical protein
MTQFIENNNKDPEKAKIIPAIVDEGLTPIIQVLDVAVNKVFKQKLKKQYYNHQLQMDIQVGKKLKVSREKLVELILQTIDEINQESSQTFLIQDVFKYCGLNPWSMENSLKAFSEHLDELESNLILKAMIKNQTAVQLG